MSKLFRTTLALAVDVKPILFHNQRQDFLLKGLRRYETEFSKLSRPRN